MLFHNLLRVAMARREYRYWSIIVQNVGTPASAAVCSIREAEWRATKGGLDLTTAATPVTATRANGTVNEYQSNFAKNMVDNSTSTGWASELYDYANTRLRFDFGVPTAVEQLALVNGNAAEAPGPFRVEASNDGVTYDLIRDCTWSTWSTATWNTFDLD